jgi:hypothetical protein
MTGTRANLSERAARASPELGEPDRARELAPAGRPARTLAIGGRDCNPLETVPPGALVRRLRERRCPRNSSLSVDPAPRPMSGS